MKCYLLLFCLLDILTLLSDLTPGVGVRFNGGIMHQYLCETEGDINFWTMQRGINLYLLTLAKSWAKWWHSLTDFNMRDYSHKHESILFGFPGHSDYAIAISYSILYAKHFIYREKLNNQNMLTIDVLSYLSHLKYILKIEKKNLYIFGFPGHSDYAIAISYSILYAKHFIYREKLNNQNMLTIDFLSYLPILNTY